MSLSLLCKKINLIKVIFPVREVWGVVASMLALTDVPMIQNQTKRLVQNRNFLKSYNREITMLCDKNINDHVKAAIIWKIKTGMYADYLESAAETYVFKYENLVKNPLEVAPLIFAHCGLEFEPGALDFNKVMTGDGPGNTSRSSNITIQSLSKWTGSLTKGQISDIDLIACFSYGRARVFA